MANQEQLIFKRGALFAGGFTLLLWLVRTVEWGLASDFGSFGILPRHLSGMIGIVTGPLVHGSFVHLLSNTFPLIMLLVAVFYFYDRIALEVFVWIYLITGAWVWIAAREAYHIGASGLVYGLAAFLFFSGVFRRDVRATSVAVAIAFLYSGMLQGVLPSTDTSISWESHLLGGAAGVFCSFYFRSKHATQQPSITSAKKPIEDVRSSTFSSQLFHSSESSTTKYFRSDDTSEELVYTYKKSEEE